MTYVAQVFQLLKLESKGKLNSLHFLRIEFLLEIEVINSEKIFIEMCLIQIHMWMNSKRKKSLTVDRN